ncbi:4-hydroxyphenylpyruvate dioxygenase [Nocardia sp. CDC159]|uniref:4-hydroxyphenylpyruvate dioxygenase n=1 Tax=Nocardia pulmonis TaxID=2951408 RepID=A0A9X2IZD6_9NOCA|nr:MULTISPECIES: 4-hydroxyphenylpyruvate dioxygenase [Nocardia]MCM6776619.1 4-hydroxyphenylpyruvate dioxygenase [Nocardia pulmonis]MCM6789232.1 4-hydroxyphenylpyruvate dioxygenase [Nocardia sp. CDC159]
MSTALPAALAGLAIDYIGFQVDSLSESTAEFVDRYGFISDTATAAGSVRLRQGDITIVLTTSDDPDHPARKYVAAHGDGIADIALTTSDARAAFAAAVRRGARPVTHPAVDPDTGAVTATIGAFGDVVHTFVQHGAARRGVAPLSAARLATVDHIAVCVQPGRLTATVEFYRDTLGFAVVYEERVVVGDQAMLSTVVQNDAGGVTLVLIEPDPTASPGQIDAFLRDHGGPGVQHLAFGTDDIVQSVGALRARGVRFLRAPDAYYTLLAGRAALDRHTVPELRARDILVDTDHDGQLFQIFTRSTHSRGTYFAEIIERQGARTFGSGNIRALYEAVELEHEGSAIR